MSEILKQVQKIFMKSSFKNGMVVELDTGKKRLFWDGRFIDQCGYISLGFYNDDLINMDSINHQDNIEKIYTVKNIMSLDDFFNERNLTLIWSR